MLKASASGQAIREVLLSIKAQEAPGNAERVKQAAQRIKKAEDDVNRERSGRQKESVKQLTDEENALARYHLARMRREREYANEKKRNDREEERRREKLATDDRRRQQEADRARQKAERDQIRWGTELAREYDKRIRDQQRMQERAAKESARASIAADREQLRWGTQLARQMDREIATRDRTRREFSQVADVRHSRTNRLGISGIGQDAVGVLRGIGHVGISAGLFGDSTESILDALLAVEGGFNITRYGAPLLANLARRRGVRGAILGGGRRLSQLLGIGVGVGGSAAGTSLSGTVGLLGAGVGAGVGAVAGAGAGLTSLIGTARDIYQYGLMGGARPGSITSGIANAEVGIANSIGGWFGYDMLGNKATSRAQSHLDQRREMAANREANRQFDLETAQMQGARADDRLAGRLRDFSYFFGKDTLKAQLFEVRGEANKLGSGDADLERGLRLRQMELNIAREMQQVENDTAARKLERYRAINALQKESLDRSKAQLQGNREALGAMAPGERSRLGSLIKQFQASKSIDGFASEDIALLKQFGGRDIAAMIQRQQQAAGEAFSRQYGIDIGQRQVAGDEDRVAKSRRQVAGASNLFSAPTGPVDLTQPTPSTFNFSINVQSDAELKEQLRKLEQQIFEIKDQQHQRAAAQRSGS